MNRTDTLIFIAIALLFVATLWVAGAEKRERWINCDIAEISPDYPIEVKQACRAQRIKT